MRRPLQEGEPSVALQTKVPLPVWQAVMDRVKAEGVTASAWLRAAIERALGGESDGDGPAE